MGQVTLTDDGELIEAVDISTDDIQDIEPEKKKKVAARSAGRYVLSGVGAGVGLGIVALVVIVLVWGVQQIQYQATIHEWKFPTFTPPEAFAVDTNSAMSLAGAMFQYLGGLLPWIAGFGMAIYVVGLFRSRR
jgi:hypothetical protein